MSRYGGTSMGFVKKYKGSEEGGNAFAKFIGIDKATLVIRLNVVLSKSIEEFDRCDEYIDYEKKKIRIEGNNLGKYKICRNGSSTKITCVNLLSGEKINRERINKVTYGKGWCEIEYGDCEEVYRAIQ